MNEKEFVSNKTKELVEIGLKSFPDDFMETESTYELELPGKTLVMGEEFFGAYEILTIDGTLVLQAENLDKAKYIIYSNRTKPKNIVIPKEETEIKSSISKYRSYLDSLIKKIESDYKKQFPGEKNFNLVTNEIFKLLNLSRI